MTLKVLLFASLAAELGTTEVSLDLPDNCTVADAVDEMVRQYPTLAQVRDRIATAVNLDYTAPQTPLKHGDELALIPPVSGG